MHEESTTRLPMSDGDTLSQLHDNADYPAYRSSINPTAQDGLMAPAWKAPSPSQQESQ